MNFSVVFRYNPQTGRDERYFRLKESYRDATGAVRNRLVLTVGFEMNDIPMEEVRQVAVGLTDLWHSNGVREDAFGDRLSCFSNAVRGYIDRYWHQILEKKRLDIVKESIAAEHRKAGRLVDVDTVKHTDAREVGAEWICLQAVRELGIDRFLEREGWTETQINTALALCINQEGFIRYSSILAGNTADPDSLPDMVDTLREKARVPQLPSGRTLVCLDAGIATEENLRRIREKGYNYLCVSRTRLTDYELAEDCRTVTVKDSREHPISLRQVMHREGGDHYLEITSPAKAMKESSMNRLFKERFETELQKARDALTKKGGKKTYEKVIERVGRAIGKYPSISKYYIIDYVRDDKDPQTHGRHQVAHRRAGKRGQAERGLFPAHQRGDARREDHLGLLQPHPRDRVHQPPAEDRSGAAPHLPPERRPLRRPPFPRAAVLLDCQHHTPQVETQQPPAQGRGSRRQIPDTLLDRDCQDDVHPEGRHHESRKRLGGEGQNADMQRAHKGGKLHLRTTQIQEDAVQENKSL